MKWKTFFRKAFLFMVLLIGTLYLANRWIRHGIGDVVDYQQHKRYEELFSPGVKAELIILGDSRSETGINPVFFEDLTPSVYNFSMSGGFVPFTRDWYQKLFKIHYPRPKVVIYGVHPGMFRSSRRLEDDSEYFPLRVFIREVLDHPDKRSALSWNRFPFLKYRGEIINFLITPLRKNSSFVKEKFYKGFLPLMESERISLAPPISEAGPFNDHPLNMQTVVNFEMLLSEFRADGIFTILVQVPEYWNGPLLPGNELYPYELKIQEIAKRQGIPYLNYNGSQQTLSNSNRAFFFNEGHLNERGSRIFSATLRKNMNDILRQIF